MRAFSIANPCTTHTNKCVRENLIRKRDTCYAIHQAWVISSMQLNRDLGDFPTQVTTYLPKIAVMLQNKSVIHLMCRISCRDWNNLVSSYWFSKIYSTVDLLWSQIFGLNYQLVIACVRYFRWISDFPQSFWSYNLFLFSLYLRWWRHGTS